jgi:hypothetical protein
MTTALVFAAFSNSLNVVNVQLVLGILLAISEVLGADPRIKANGIVSFALLQVKEYLRTRVKK